jgi:hypothetical protein
MMLESSTIVSKNLVQDRLGRAKSEGDANVWVW